MKDLKVLRKQKMKNIKTYKEFVEAELELAQKIWDSPFASSNLDKLTKQELVILIHCILDRVSNDKKEWYELDLKDFLFEQKCWLIECLDNNFFKREK